jgi:hypothetical protein
VISKVDLDQQMQLIEDEDSCGFPIHVNEDDDKLKTFTIREDNLRSLMMIEGIEIFLPLAQGEAKIWVTDATTTEEQPVVTVREEGLKQIFEASQAVEENGNFEEWLNIFSQKPEEAVALKLTAEEADDDDEHSEEGLNIFSQDIEKTATWEFVEEEETDNISLTDMYEQIESLERRVKVQGMHIQ